MLVSWKCIACGDDDQETSAGAQKICDKCGHDNGPTTVIQVHTPETVKNEPEIGPGGYPRSWDDRTTTESFGGATGPENGQIQDVPCDLCVRGCHDHEGPMVCSGRCSDLLRAKESFIDRTAREVHNNPKWPAALFGESGQVSVDIEVDWKVAEIATCKTQLWLVSFGTLVGPWVEWVKGTRGFISLRNKPGTWTYAEALDIVHKEPNSFAYPLGYLYELAGVQTGVDVAKLTDHLRLYDESNTLAKA